MRPSATLKADQTLQVSYDDVAAATRALAGQCHRTPVLTSHTVDQRTGTRVFFKCENLQRGGAFKFRGAYNALSNLSPEQKRRGVVAYSSGNHAQAVALAGRVLGVKTIGVEPAAGDDVTRSFRTGTIQSVHNPDTIADGARTSAPGKVTFPLILHYVHDMLTVTDEELLHAMFYLWERMKIVVELTGALGIAALFEKKFDASGKRVGVILSGGNADFKHLCSFL